MAVTIATVTTTTTIIVYFLPTLYKGIVRGVIQRKTYKNAMQTKIQIAWKLDTE